MFKNRVQIGRLGGVDGLVGNAGNLEFKTDYHSLQMVEFAQNGDGLPQLIITNLSTPLLVDKEQDTTITENYGQRS